MFLNKFALAMCKISFHLFLRTATLGMPLGSWDSVVVVVVVIVIVVKR